ncbi:MAG: alpha/beta hydrolase [Anaerolineales bacterium]|nr:alpha/beta hydrolase [Anaerolineales bacterium]
MPSRWTENDIQVSGARLHYYRTGRGTKRPLVLLHGFSDNGLCWIREARGLEAEYDVILPDARAHGRSERMRPGDAVDLASDAAGIIRALGLKRPVVVGHSMGAMTAFQAGVRFPELVRALVLEDPPWRLPSPVQTPIPHPPESMPMVQWAVNLPHQSLEELLAQNRRDHPGWPEELVCVMSEAKKQLDPAIVYPLVEEVQTRETEWLKTIGRVACPMLVFTGNPALGGLMTSEAVAKIRGLNPAAEIVHVPDAGHLIRFDRYAVFMEALRGFLKRIDY